MIRGLHAPLLDFLAPSLIPTSRFSVHAARQRLQRRYATQAASVPNPSSPKKPKVGVSLTQEQKEYLDGAVGRFLH